MWMLPRKNNFIWVKVWTITKSYAKRSLVPRDELCDYELKVIAYPGWEL